jgi:predicted glycoside hydrolase/deacetylase ChbG (UPF0249 family)
MERRLIINADDFGLCESVNKGIVEAHANGVLTSTTIMSNMPALGLSAHFNLTSKKTKQYPGNTGITLMYYEQLLENIGNIA